MKFICALVLVVSLTACSSVTNKMIVPSLTQAKAQFLVLPKKEWYLTYTSAPECAEYVEYTQSLDRPSWQQYCYIYTGETNKIWVKLDMTNTQAFFRIRRPIQ